MRQGFTIPGGLADVLADVRFRIFVDTNGHVPYGCTSREREPLYSIEI
jgi:hypothetical protein